ncbi:TVP38/TMEM64 family protein [Thalassotalea mangrovi]|uniref:TVP38/TMEM64 family membrane protein n=1 Tax=Thalassotalea mangrovi TaxID=2572245 RepID=A0A4V5NXL4_9GAMM|nr:VTT domain-containing protein [Thalassotalea mangrovi]TKB46615.1 VTT domain-containing protein [Thalassotalea mangrovi]
MFRQFLTRINIEHCWHSHRLTITLVLGFLLLGIIITAAIHFSGLSQYFNLQTLNEFAHRFEQNLTLYFLVFMTLGTAIGLPRQICAFSGGYLFGSGMGILLASTAAITGCLLTVLVARYGLHYLMLPRFQPQVSKIHDLLKHRTFSKTLMVRFIPAGNNFLFNLCAGVARVPLRPYLAGSYLGFLPQMSIFALMGSGIKVQSSTQISVSVLLAVISVIIAWSLRKR